MTQRFQRTAKRNRLTNSSVISHCVLKTECDERKPAQSGFDCHHRAVRRSVPRYIKRTSFDYVISMTSFLGMQSEYKRAPKRIFSSFSLLLFTAPSPPPFFLTFLSLPHSFTPSGSFLNELHVGEGGRILGSIMSQNATTTPPPVFSFGVLSGDGSGYIEIANGTIFTVTGMNNTHMQNQSSNYRPNEPDQRTANRTNRIVYSEYLGHLQMKNVLSSVESANLQSLVSENCIISNVTLSLSNGTLGNISELSRNFYIYTT